MTPTLMLVGIRVLEQADPFMTQFFTRTEIVGQKFADRFVGQFLLPKIVEHIKQRAYYRDSAGYPGLLPKWDRVRTYYERTSGLKRRGSSQSRD